MSIQNRVLQFLQLYTNFRALNPEALFEPLPVHGDFDGPDPAECRDLLARAVLIVDSISTEDLLRTLPWHSFNGMQGVLQNLYNTCVQYQASRDQGSYQNFASNLDSFVYHLRTLGFTEVALGQGRLEQTRLTIDSELKKLLESNIQVEGLKAEVRALIAPAVAGSLSEAFTARRNALLKGRVTWAVIAGIGGVASIWATFAFVGAVSEALTQMAAAKAPISAAWPAVLVRSVVLVPLYAVFGFAFSQYKKERDFEEEYAHKAAVATSLPNYGDLAREPAVRDQIVTGATSVIFTSPTAQAHVGRKNEVTMSSVSQLIESLSKLAPGKSAG